MKRIVIGVFVLVNLLSGCDSGPDCTKTVQQSELDEVNAAQLAIDNAIIDDYIVANSLSGVQEVNGIKYIITKEGSGVTPCLENNITVSYTGRFLSNGNVFDKNLSGLTFPLNKFIVGWQLALPNFTKGTSVTLFIPSGYGYGPSGFPPDIPENANLIFSVDLTNVR